VIVPDYLNTICEYFLKVFPRHRKGGDHIFKKLFSHEKWSLPELLMGVESPIPSLRLMPLPPRGLQLLVFSKTELDPLCRTEALRREPSQYPDFSRFSTNGCELPFMLVLKKAKKIIR
jgi:hypothetical protein